MATRRTGARSGARVFTGTTSRSIGLDDFTIENVEKGIDLFRRGRDALTGGMADPKFPPPAGGFSGTCPKGFKFVNGECIEEGFGGFMKRTLPGGETGTLPTTGFGEAVLGSFNIPALVPRQTGTVILANGTVRPTLGCPRGAVLGKDSLCYQKGSIPITFRKWRPAARPPVTAADARAIRKADSAKNRVEKLAKSTGLFVARSRPKSRPRAAGKKC